jgi:hypothetical protein
LTEEVEMAKVYNDFAKPIFGEYALIYTNVALVALPRLTDAPMPELT